ncbi:MAG: hydantoinase/oxoprolinase N-terminal domain-containing protein, partial [Actinomycetota bacterium]
MRKAQRRSTRRTRTYASRSRASRGRTVSHRVAIDIGGTFTDLAAVDSATGELVVSKASTTPGRLDE